jgi:predicted acylesterase/phospholipase RssA
MPRARTLARSHRSCKLRGVRAERLALIVLASCGLACAAYQNVGVESDPPGAKIYLDGEIVGQTPAKLRVSRDAPHTVFLKREGYKPELVLLERHEATDGIDFLTPADITKRLSPGPSDDPELERRLKIEVEKPKN